MTSIGKARARVSVQRQSLTTDDMGGHTEAWTTQFTAWARIKALSAGKRVFLGREVGEVTHEVDLLTPEVDVKQHDRLLWQDGSRAFDVIELAKDFEARVVHLVVKEVPLDAVT